MIGTAITETEKTATTATPATDCAAHPGTGALYVCDGCKRPLCDLCISAGHALLFCRHCGERALPLAPAVGPGGGADARPSPAATSAKEHKRRKAINLDYRLVQAFGYPFRGMGKFLFFIALFCQAGVEILVRFGAGGFRFMLAFGFWSLLVGLQLKIARSTCLGDDELPDWPDYFSVGERAHDLWTFAILTVLRYGLPGLFVYAGKNLIERGAGLPFWIGIALAGWIGAAAFATALGAVGQFSLDLAPYVKRHAQAFFACGGDAVRITNMIFGLDLAVWLARLAFVGVPIANSAVPGILGTYGMFVSAHLAGLLFRRNAHRLDEIY